MKKIHCYSSGFYPLGKNLQIIEDDKNNLQIIIMRIKYNMSYTAKHKTKSPDPEMEEEQ